MSPQEGGLGGALKERAREWCLQLHALGCVSQDRRADAHCHPREQVEKSVLHKAGCSALAVHCSLTLCGCWAKGMVGLGPCSGGSVKHQPGFIIGFFWSWDSKFPAAKKNMDGENKCKGVEEGREERNEGETLKPNSKKTSEPLHCNMHGPHKL